MNPLVFQAFAESKMALDDFIKQNTAFLQTNSLEHPR